MDIYAITLIRDGHIQQMWCFSSKEKAIEWLDKLLLRALRIYSNLDSVKAYADALVMEWCYMDEYLIRKVEVDPE